MPGMLDLVQRAPVFHRLAKASRLPNAQTNPLIDVMIARLTGPPALPANRIATIAEDMGFYASAAQADHFKRDWLNDPPGGGFWPTIDTEGILRTGLATLLQTFKLHGRPIEFFWAISGDQNSSRWEMSITVCTTVIVVIFHTPHFPCFVPTQQSSTMTIVRVEGGTPIARPVLEPVPPAAAAAVKAKTPGPRARRVPRRQPPRGPKKGR